MTARLFCPRAHIWLRLIKEVAAGGLVAPRAAWRIQLGLTERGIEDIGSVLTVQPLASAGQSVVRPATSCPHRPH